MTGWPSLNLSATSWAWSKRRGRTVVGSMLGVARSSRATCRGRGRLADLTPESSLVPMGAARPRRVEVARREVGRAGTA